MLTKAIIKEIPKENSNIYKVEVPILKNNYSINNKLDASLLDAILINTPGIYNGFKPNDIVVVGFENNKLDKAIILGKLFINCEEDISTTINCSSINISNEIKLPPLIDNTFTQLTNIINSLENKITTLENKVNVLESKLK